MKTKNAAPKGPKGGRIKHKSLKSKIRDIQRMLNKKKDLDPSVRKQFEEQMDDLRAQVDSKAQKQKLKKIHNRYKGVKFIGFPFSIFVPVALTLLSCFLERKKIMRKLNSLRAHHDYLMDPKHHKPQLIQSKDLPTTPQDCFELIKHYEDLLLYVDV